MFWSYSGDDFLILSAASIFTCWNKTHFKLKKTGMNIYNYNMMVSRGSKPDCVFENETGKVSVEWGQIHPSAT